MFKGMYTFGATVSGELVPRQVDVCVVEECDSHQEDEFDYVISVAEDDTHSTSVFPPLNIGDRSSKTQFYYF